MQTITQILEYFNTLSTYIYIFQTSIEPFTILKEIPRELIELFDDIELVKLISDVINQVKKLNEYLEPKLKILKKYLNKRKKHPFIKNDIPYADFKIDEAPIIKTKEDEQLTLSFFDIIKKEDITPVRRRKDIKYEGCCPHCGAPNEYLYDNNGQNKQFFCKACKNTFTVKTTPRDTAGFYCPHCGRKLVAKHDRSGYIVYACINNKCSYYKQAKKNVKENPDEYKTSSDQFRLHYHYREFKFNIEEVKKACENKETKVDLSRIHVDDTVLGLILTYYVNYGMSSRKVSSVLRDVHGLKISHQTVMNYASSVSKILKSYIDNYPYKLGSTLAGDETYVDVKGKQHYVFFFSDPKSKIITSYDISERRDTRCAVISIYKCLNKYKEIPKDLTFITDANPIYNAAQLFFELINIMFDLHQVIGLSNKTEDSIKYRPIKQTQERLNRTFKQNYYGTNGYGSLRCANEYMVLYVTFFNFLRRHSALKFKTPVDDGLFDEQDLMQDKWIKLINLACGA